MRERAGDFKFEKAISLNSNAMHDLNNLFQEYFGKISYSATLECASEELNMSFDELMSRDVFLENRIVKLLVKDTNKKLEVIICSKACAWANYDYTVYIRYLLPSEDHEYKFKKALNKIYKLAEPKYSFLYTLSPLKFTVITIALGIIRIIHNIVYNWLQKGISLEESNLMFLLFLSIFFGLGIFIFMLWEKWFPPVVFLWNEEIKNDEKRATFRKLVVSTLSGLTAAAIWFVFQMVMNFI